MTCVFPPTVALIFKHVLFATIWLARAAVFEGAACWSQAFVLQLPVGKQELIRCGLAERLVYLLFSNELSSGAASWRATNCVPEFYFAF